ncbi:hypothetical protein LAZ67_4004017, partial [Cordylochernes scorpioides]
MVETRSGKMQDPAQERIQAEESAKPQPGATIGRDASFDPVVLNPNIDIPKYDGTDDPRPWIESLEEIGFLYHWADYIISRYAAMNMTGSAKTWLNLHKASFTSWENIKIRLIQDFSLDANKEELRMKLNRMQHWNEPAIRFAEDILVLCNKVDPAMEEETKIEHVIGGLKKEYSFAFYLNPPKTTDDLLVVCKKMDSFEKKYRERVEKSRNLYNGPRYSRPQQQSRYVPPTAARNYQTTSRPQAPVSNYYKNDSPPTPRQYRNNFPQPSTPRRPYNPNFVPKPNLQRNTYNKSQEVSKNRTEDGRPICFKCNKPGHVARYCRVKFIRILEEDPADTQEKIFRVGGFKLSVAPESVNQSKSTINGIKKLDPKYKLKINVDKIGTFEALVDTGADLSVVDLRTALDTGHGISKLAKICAGPDGKKLDMVGSIFLNIKIDDETLSHNFVILKTHLRTLILGRDFLKKMNAKIDCKQETIKYDLTNNHDEINFEMLKIKSAKDSIVPECSMKLIKALVETEDGEYIIEESSKMFQTNGLRLARSLINVINRETHIWITNPYPRPLKIMKNQTLAFGSSPAKINVSREREVEKNEEPRFQINENLPPKEQKELKQVLERYGDLFSSRLGRTNLAKHRIDTEDAKPIKHKPYRVSAKERDIIKEQIDEMLTEGIIRPSSSPWSFPVILVKKRDGKYRFCVDYRKLNNVTVKDVYPIPRIDEVMDTLQGSTHFSAIDLRSGYWQVEVEERDKEKTAFTTAHVLYEFNVMPFGLCNAPATFERNMENMLGNLRWQICLCYLDDVIIYSPDFPTHLKRLEAVFRCFRESNLRLNDKKCRFAFEELEILGYITSKHGIKPAEHNIKAVRNFPRPKKVKEVQSFLGMCSYYRKFIKDFSKIADPLTNLIKKSVSFTWTERQEEAFQTLKTALLSPPILGHFNPNAPTYVHTDASNIGIGATLVQDIGGEEKVISYLSRTLSKAEQNYSTTEKECLAVVWSMSKLRPYLYGRHFKIVTDHHALCWLKNLKDPTGRLARWALKIQEYDFDIIHKSGKKHLDADGLSRGPLPETDWDEDFERLFLNQITDEEDKFIESVKKNLNGSRRSIAQNFKEEDGCLFKKNPNPEGRAWLLVVPENKKREIMKEYHNHMSNGHLGVARTMYRIKSKYFWPSMLKDVSEFVKTCHLCQSRKGSNQLPSGLLQPIPPANFPFERIGIDFVGPLPSTKNRKKWIIVLTDYYTRYAETRAVSEATVKEVSKFLVEDIFLRHGAPQYLISDRGSQFTSNLMKEVMKTCKIKHCFTTSYHPQTNGLTERLNRTLINMLSMYVNTDQKNWDEILPFITHAYNTTIQETTGYSPFFLMFGREPTSLLDDRNISVDIDKDDYDEYIKHHLDKINRTRKLVINNTIKTQERMKKNYDKKHMERIYEPGELVAVWTPIRKIGKCEKLLRKYFGPYRILKKLSNVNYLIEPKDNPGQDPLIVHVSRIKPYFERIDEVNHEDMSESNNNVDVQNSESSDGSSIQVINRKCGSRKRLWVSSDSSDCSSKNIATNTSIGRKRSCNPDNWARNIQKQKRTKGLAYRNRGGYSIPAKTFVDIICRCRQKCNQKILSYDREAAMKTFYSLDSQLAQNIFLRGCIRAKEIKRRRPSNNTKEPRSHSFTYYFRKDKHDIPVCKKYFRDTYQVSDGRIYKCSSKEQVTSLFDQRKGRAASNKIDDTHVVKHIKSFPAYTSHYTRAHNPRRQYLNPDLNIKKMYELYATQCKKKNVVPVKEKYYYKVFSTKFNLHFKQPSKDTCQTCDYLQIKIQSSDSEGIQMAKIEKENHLEEAERARSLMAADRKAASDKIFVFSFDLEKALAFPKLTTSVAYYKRNLYVYNFGCHDFNENIGHMFVWPETEGSRLISTLQLVERLDRYPLRNKRKIDSVEPEETSMNVKKEGTQVSNYVVQHLPRNPSIFSGEDGENLQKWLKGYARVAKYNHWDETLCLTKVYFYLSGTALKWFENNEESIQTWKEFTSQLENVFGKKENSKLQAEKKLKTRAQLKGESTECYIQDVLCLCKEVDPQMSEEDKISHLMKGIAEELYQALLPRDVQSTEQFITDCRRVEALRCRRVTPTKYELLPNVASLCDQDDEEDLSSLIRKIVREEIKQALDSPQEEPKIAVIEDLVREEIVKTLAPRSKPTISPTQASRPRYEAQTIRPHSEPHYRKQGRRCDTNEWRTTEGKPICFYCGRPGHVVRYCRDRKRHNEERRNKYFQRKQDAMEFYNSQTESQEPNDESSRKNFSRYRIPTPYTAVVSNLNLRKMETENKPSDTSEICKVSVKIPPFWVEKPEIWFFQASVQLERVGKLQPADRVATSSSAGIQDCRNLRLFVTDKNTGLRFLVDSGADISIIPPKDKNRMPSSDYKLYAANGTEIVTYGTKVRNLDIGLRRQFQWPFVIANTNRAIIGADFLNNFGLIIDIKNKRLIDGITNLSIRGVIQSISDMGNISTLNSSSKVSAILTKYPNLCRPPSDFVEAKHSVKHYIPTRGQPIHSKARCLDSQRLTLAKAEFQYMLNNGIIRPSNSPWASPLHLVSKKDESLRPCGDYRRLNAITLPDRYPIPRLDDFHHILKGTRVYSKIDLCKAFYQIPIAEEDKPKTAIITPFGLFEFNVMSFGLRNATATFQIFMHEVLRNLDFAFVYLDDILVASKTEEEHYSHLETLFSRLNSYGLRINLSKSKFLVQEIDFLGYLITSHGVKPLPTKVKAILEYKKPKTVHELRIFLGMLNFYRTFLNNAAETQAILHEYLRGAKKKNRSEIKWTEEAEVQFEKCKQALANTALLAYPDTELPISLCTDASDRAVGSVLQQLDNNNWKPIAFFSKKLNPAQCNYSTYDRELLAIYLSIKFFKHLLEAREFTILTDHKPLIYAFKQKNEKASPGQLRHLQYISQFSTDIKYIKGTDNIVADALSRVDAITTIDYEEIAKEQTGDPELQNLISKNTSLKFKQCPLQSGNLLWCDVSTNNIRPFIPIKFRMMVFRNFLELSHPGIKATTKQLTSRFIWPNMNKDIRKWARACVNCQKCKVSIHTKSEIGKYQEVDERFSVVHIDLIGPLPPSNGNIYCLTCIDRYTSWMEVVPLPDMKSETVARAFYENWIVRFGAPHTVISDRGKQFTSQLFKDLTTLCGIKLRHSTAYHPQCNGKIERLHRTIKTAIRAHNSIKWTETLPTVLLGSRAAINKDTNHSLSQMVYGKTIRLPGEFFDDSKHHLHAEEFVQQLQKQMELLKPLNEKHHSKTKVFVHKDLKTCSHVFIRTDRVKKPLEPPYEGPFPVLERTDKYFTLKVKGKNVTTSIDRLRPAYLLADSDNITAEHPAATRPIVSGALPSTSSQQNPDPPDVEKYTEFQGTGSAPDLTRTRSGRIIKKPASSACECSPPGDEWVIHATEPNLNKVAVDPQLCRREDGQGVVLKAGPEDPSLQVRGPPDDVEGLQDEVPDGLAAPVTVAQGTVDRPAGSTR